MIRDGWNNIRDDIDEPANRAGAIEDCRRTTNHVDLRNADRLDRCGMRGIKSRQIARAKAVFENQHLVVAQASQNRARWRGSEAAHRDTWKIGDFLGEAHTRNVRELYSRLGRGRLVLI